MTVQQWLADATQKLDQTGIGTARLDALILLEDILGVDRAHLLAELDTKISTPQQAQLQKLLAKRAKHIPLAYVRGHTEFYGRRFVITPAVLEPRPESEAMIDELKKLSDLPSQVPMADVGAGSGALGITAALEVPTNQVELLELDTKALEVAKNNVDKFTLDMLVTQSDLLTNAQSKPQLLLCNLPYVPDDHRINRAAQHEPHIAIFGGTDGLDLYRRLFMQLTGNQQQVLYILTESLPSQHETLNALATNAGFQLTTKNDFIQVFKRVLK